MTVTRMGDVVFGPAEVTEQKHGHGHDHKTEQYVEDEAALTRLETRTERSLKNGWNDLYANTLKALGISNAKAPEPVFVFDLAGMLPLLESLREEFVAEYGASDAVLASSMFDAWLRGLANASAELDVSDFIADSTRSRIARQISEEALGLVRDATVRAYRDDIVKALSDGAYNGLNPKEVASKLKQRFAAHGVDWERIARSEIAAAQAQGKLDLYGANAISRYDWIRAGGACPICVGRAENGPYVVGSGPIPVRDSHPNCRCTVEAATT